MSRLVNGSSLRAAQIATVIFTIVAALVVAACSPQQDTSMTAPTGEATLPEPQLEQVVSPFIQRVGFDWGMDGFAIPGHVPGWTCGSEPGRGAEPAVGTAPASGAGCVSDSGEAFTFDNVSGEWAQAGDAVDLTVVDASYVFDDLMVGEFVAFPGGACAASAAEELTCVDVEERAGFTLNASGMSALNDDQVSDALGSPPVVPTTHVTVDLDGAETWCTITRWYSRPEVACQSMEADWGIDPVVDTEASIVSFHLDDWGSHTLKAANFGQDMRNTTRLEPGTYRWDNGHVDYDGSQLRISYAGYDHIISRNSFDVRESAKEGAPIELHEETINVDGKDRSFLISAPEGWKNTALPVVYVVHGKGSNPTRMADATRFHDHAEAIIVYPEGESAAWGPTFYAEDPTGHEDLAFLDAIDVFLRSRFAVDGDRVYITGFSNGGGFARFMTCQRPERFARFSSSGAAVYESVLEGCGETNVPYLNIHGRGDDLVDYNGGVRTERGRDYRYLAVEDVLEDAARRNSCEDSGDLSATRGHADGYPIAVSTVSFEPCMYPVFHINANSLRHFWPRGEASASGVDATLESLEFFGVRHTLRSENGSIVNPS